jgi:hypothetical protein
MRRKIIIVFLLILINTWHCNKNKSVSRFDRVYNECKNSECKYRQHDEDCIYKCISKSCYEKLFFDFIFELGEIINNEIKSKFENCFNRMQISN